MRAALSPDSNTLSRIAELMRAAQGTRLKAQDTADRATAWLAPAVLVLGTVTFCTWTGLGVSAARKVSEEGGSRGLAVRETVVDAIRHSVAVLIVSCPCGITLCVPMVAVIAVAVGARRRFLFKTVEALESAYDVQVVVFDKTGTLTLGKLSVNSSTYYPQDSLRWLSTERGIQSVVRALTGSLARPVSAAVHDHVVAALAAIPPPHSDAFNLRVIPG